MQVGQRLLHRQREGNNYLPSPLQSWRCRAAHWSPLPQGLLQSLKWPDQRQSHCQPEASRICLPRLQR